MEANLEMNYARGLSQKFQIESATVWQIYLGRLRQKSKKSKHNQKPKVFSLSGVKLMRTKLKIKMTNLKEMKPKKKRQKHQLISN